MKSVGLEEIDWLRCDQHEAGVFLQYDAQDARICIANGFQNGRPIQYAINFLDGRTSGGTLRPFVYDCGRRDYIEIKKFPHQENSLCRVFDAIIKNALGEDDDASIGLNQEIINTVHKLTFDIRAKMFSEVLSSFREDAAEWQRSIASIGRQLSCRYND